MSLRTCEDLSLCCRRSGFKLSLPRPVFMLKSGSWACKLVLQVKALAAKSDNLSLALRIHVVGETRLLQVGFFCFVLFFVFVFVFVFVFFLIFTCML